jgi:hypothetical protein
MGIARVLAKGGTGLARRSDGRAVTRLWGTEILIHHAATS